MHDGSESFSGMQRTAAMLGFHGGAQRQAGNEAGATWEEAGVPDARGEARGRAPGSGELRTERQGPVGLLRRGGEDVVAGSRYGAPLEEGVEGLRHELLLEEDDREAAEQGEVSLIRS